MSDALRCLSERSIYVLYGAALCHNEPTLLVQSRFVWVVIAVVAEASVKL